MSSTTLRVKELLRVKGWTMKVLSEKTGMSESYLTHIKNSTRRWNEDALEKIAAAFEIRPVDLIMEVDTKNKQTGSDLKIKVSFLPVVSALPVDLTVLSETSATFIPTAYHSDKSLFALFIDSNCYAPTFFKGDYLFISPETKIKTGDVAAVEYGKGAVRVIAKVTFKDTFIVLEFLQEKQHPVALIQGTDHFKVIGRVIQRIQKI